MRHVLEDLLVRRDDPLGQTFSVRATDGDVDDEAGREPGRAGVAGAGVGDEGGDPDREREDRPDDCRHRDLRAADVDVERGAVGPRQVGLGDPEPDHCDEGVDGGQEGDVVVGERGGADDPARDHRRGRDRLRRDERTPVQASERARQLAVLAERVGEPREARDRRRDRGEQDQCPARPDEEANCVAEPERNLATHLLGDADERCAQPAVPERRVGPGERGDGDDGDCDVDRHDRADRDEERAREVDARPPRLLREVRDRLEAGVGEHREGHCEEERVPGRRGTERGSMRERVRREEEDEAGNDEEQLHEQVECRDDEADGVERRTPEEPYRRDEHDRADRDHDIPGVALERVDPESGAEVVRHEERGERDHDQVVEEERPAGHEPGQVVERDADEGRGAARLSDRRRPFGVRHRHDEEQHADDREDDRREPERMQRDDAEREVERGRHLAVRDGGERRRVQHALQPRQLAGHRPVSLSPPQEVKPSAAER